MSKVRFLGLDVHAETIAVAVAEPTGEVHSIGTIPNRIESIRKMIYKLGPVQQLSALGHRIRHQAVQTGCSDQQRNTGKDTQQQHSRS